MRYNGVSIFSFYQDLAASVPEGIEVLVKPCLNDSWMFIFQRKAGEKPDRMAEYLVDNFIRTHAREAKEILLNGCRNHFKGLENKP